MLILIETHININEVVLTVHNHIMTHQLINQLYMYLYEPFTTVNWCYVSCIITYFMYYCMFHVLFAINLEAGPPLLCLPITQMALISLTCQRFSVEGMTSLCSSEELKWTTERPSEHSSANGFPSSPEIKEQIKNRAFN